MTDYREKLRPLVEAALVREETVLASGKKSSFYFDGKLVTMRPDGAFYLAKHILETIPSESWDAIGGLTLGADAIAAAVSALSFESGGGKAAFIVRKDRKGHGRMKRIEGPLEAGSRVVVVDDVATSGASIMEAVKAVEEERGCTVVRVLALVDRQQGARELFESAGYRFSPVFTAEELGVSRDEILAGGSQADPG